LGDGQAPATFQPDTEFAGFDKDEATRHQGEGARDRRFQGLPAV
jgi:hypothetical protein